MLYFTCSKFIPCLLQAFLFKIVEYYCREYCALNMKNRPAYFKLWIWIPIVMILGFLLKNPTDIFVYTDHYQFNPQVWAIGISIFLFVSGLGYYMYRKSGMNEMMAQNHLKFTAIGCLMCAFTAAVVLVKNRNVTEVMDASQFTGFSIDQAMAILFMIGVFIIFLGLLLYFINFIMKTFFVQD